MENNKTKEVQIKIEEKLKKLNNKYCKDYADNIWNSNFLLNPKEDKDMEMVEKIRELYESYMTEAHEEEINYSNILNIREELEKLI